MYHKVNHIKHYYMVMFVNCLYFYQQFIDEGLHI